MRWLIVSVYLIISAALVGCMSGPSVKCTPIPAVLTKKAETITLRANYDSVPANCTPYAIDVINTYMRKKQDETNLDAINSLENWRRNHD